MKLRFTVEFEVANDWDDLARTAGPVEGRKQFVGTHMRAVLARAAMAVTSSSAAGYVNVVGLTVSEPEWIGWDNAKIAAAVEGGSDE